MWNSEELISLRREVAAIQIPSGAPLTLPAGTEVRITQSLGGTYTVLTPWGLARVEGKDADALGLQPEPSSTNAQAVSEPTSAEEVQKAVWEQLKTCYDPEIPVNIVDLGLVYSCQVKPLEGGGYRVEVRFTLTAPGCGMGDWLAHDIRQKVESIPGVKEADVQVVFDPPWHHDMMSDAAKLELGWF
ncbi:MAG: putative Fe-S cluster assembly protein SufT [Candidatus Binatia bacterium]|nr:putative Fe-S cluster assembly protein SufT [Candidatus Binatia bacterium]